MVSKFHRVSWPHIFHPNYFSIRWFKSVINLSFRIFYQAYSHVAKSQFVLNSFTKRSYLKIPDLLQTVSVFVKLQEKSYQRCLLIYHLCCYLNSRRKIWIILRICKFARISWIFKNRKNFGEYFMLACYGLFVLSTAGINIKNNLIFTYPPW